jgi:hypothetical protein
VHSLEDLLPEKWALGDRAETVNPRRVGLMLSIEGLNRLARQVIREFVAHAPTDQIDEFDYRTALPNFLRVSWHRSIGSEAPTASPRRLQVSISMDWCLYCWRRWHLRPESPVMAQK